MKEKRPALSIEKEKLEKLKDLRKGNQAIFTYQEFKGDSIGSVEYQYVLIEQGKSKELYTSTELYNIYEDQSGMKEYYVLEAELNLHDTVQRQKILDYRLVETQDSVYFSDVDMTEIELVRNITMAIDERDFEIYIFNGYSHPGEPDISNLRFWSPQFGTVLIWFGQGISYELVSTGVQADAEVLKALRREIKLYLDEIR